MVYLIHFESKLHHAQHYIGFCQSDFFQRMYQHASGHGAKLLAAVNRNGINWYVAHIWYNEDRRFERLLKNRKKSPCICPICKGLIKMEKQS